MPSSIPPAPLPSRPTLAVPPPPPLAPLPVLAGFSVNRQATGKVTFAPLDLSKRVNRILAARVFTQATLEQAEADFRVLATYFEREQPTDLLAELDARQKTGGTRGPGERQRAVYNALAHSLSQMTTRNPHASATAIKSAGSSAALVHGKKLKSELQRA